MAKDVLYGNRAEGLYGVAGASKFSVASVTSSGVSITTTATRQAPAPTILYLYKILLKAIPYGGQRRHSKAHRGTPCTLHTSAPARCLAAALPCHAYTTTPRL